MPFYRFFFGGGFPYEIDCRKKGALILTALLEDPGAVSFFFFFLIPGGQIRQTLGLPPPLTCSLPNRPATIWSGPRRLSGPILGHFESEPFASGFPWATEPLRLLADLKYTKARSRAGGGRGTRSVGARKAGFVLVDCILSDLMCLF